MYNGRIKGERKKNSQGRRNAQTCVRVGKTQTLIHQPSTFIIIGDENYLFLASVKTWLDHTELETPGVL